MQNVNEDAAAVVLFLFAREKLLFRYPASNPFELGVPQQSAHSMHPVSSYAALPYNHSTLSLSSNDNTNVASGGRGANTTTTSNSVSTQLMTQTEKDESHATPPLPPAPASATTSQNTSFTAAPALPTSAASATSSARAGGVPPQRPLLRRSAATTGGQGPHHTSTTTTGSTNSNVPPVQEKPVGRSALSRNVKHPHIAPDTVEGKQKATAAHSSSQQQQHQPPRSVASPTVNNATSNAVSLSSSCGTDSCVGIPTSVFMHLLRATPALCTTLHMASVTFLIYRIVLSSGEAVHERRPHDSYNDDDEDEEKDEDSAELSAASPARATLSRRTRRRRSRTMTAMLVVALRRPDTDRGTIARFVQCFVNVLAREERRGHYVTSQLELMERLSNEHASRRSSNHRNNNTNNSAGSVSHRASVTERGGRSGGNKTQRVAHAPDALQGTLDSDEEEEEEDYDEEEDSSEEEREEEGVLWGGRRGRKGQVHTSVTPSARHEVMESQKVKAEVMRHECVFTALAEHPRATLCAEIRQLTQCLELWSRRRPETSLCEQKTHMTTTNNNCGCALGCPAMRLTPAGAVWADVTPATQQNGEENDNSSSEGDASAESICINSFLRLPLRLLTGTAMPSCAKSGPGATQFHPCDIVRLCDAQFPLHLQADYISEVGQEYTALLPLSTVLNCLRGLRVPWRMGAFYRSLSWALLEALMTRLNQSAGSHNSITSSGLVRRGSALATASASARAAANSVASSSNNGGSIPTARLSPFLRSSVPTSTVTALPLPSSLTSGHWERRERGGADNHSNTTQVATTTTTSVVMAQALRQVAAMSFLTLAVLQLLCRRKAIATESTMGIWFTHGDILPPPLEEEKGEGVHSGGTEPSAAATAGALRRATMNECTSDIDTSGDDEEEGEESPVEAAQPHSRATTLSTLSVLYMLQRLAELPAQVAPMAGPVLGSGGLPLQQHHHLTLATDLSSSGYTNALPSGAFTPSPAPTVATTTIVPLQTVPPTPSPAYMSTFTAAMPFAAPAGATQLTTTMNTMAGSNALCPGSPCTPLSGSTERTSRTPLTNAGLSRTTTGIFAANTTSTSGTMPPTLLPPAATTTINSSAQQQPTSRSWQQLQLLRKRHSAGQICHTPIRQASQPPSSQAISTIEDMPPASGTRRDNSNNNNNSSSSQGLKQLPSRQQQQQAACARQSWAVGCAWGAACPLCEALASHPAYWMLPHGSGQVPVVLDFPALDAAVRRWAALGSPGNSDGPIATTVNSREMGSNTGMMDETHMPAQLSLQAGGPLFDGFSSGNNNVMMMGGEGVGGGGLLTFAHSLEQRPWFLRPEIYMTPDPRYDDSPLMVHKRQLMRHETTASSVMPDASTSPTRVPSITGASNNNNSNRKAAGRNASPRHKTTPRRIRPQGKCANVIDQSQQDAHVLLCASNVPAAAAQWLRRAAARIHARLRHARTTADATAARAATALHSAICTATAPAIQPAVTTSNTIPNSSGDVEMMSKSAGASPMMTSTAVPVHQSSAKAVLPPHHPRNNNNDNADETLATSARSSLFQSLDTHHNATSAMLHRAETTRQVVVGSVGSPTRPRSVRYSKRLLPDRSANLRLLPTVVVSALHENASPELTRTRTGPETHISGETPGDTHPSREAPQSPTGLSALWLGPAQRSIPTELLLQFAFHHLVVLLWGRQGSDIEVVLRLLERNLRRLQPFLQYLPYLKQLVAAGYTSETAAMRAQPHMMESSKEEEQAAQPLADTSAERRPSSTAAAVTPASAAVRLSPRDVQLLQTYELYDQLALLDYLLPYAHYKVDIVPATLLLHAMVNEFNEVLFVAAVAEDALQR